MAIFEQVAVLQTQTFIQGDARDPLGIWGGRNIITGDATGGSIKTVFQVAEERSASYVYTCYTALIAQLSGTQVAARIKARLLTNWPDVDVAIGIQGAATGVARLLAGDADFTAPVMVPDGQLVNPNERFLLLFDPRPGRNAVLELIELELGVNTDTAIFAFECWGYFWDRAVMQAPGGPRHPGS